VAGLWLAALFGNPTLAAALALGYLAARQRYFTAYALAADARSSAFHWGINILKLLLVIALGGVALVRRRGGEAALGARPLPTSRPFRRPSPRARPQTALRVYGSIDVAAMVRAAL
jgi:hypothetical protein